MANYFERIDALRNNTNFTVEDYEASYLTAELILTDLFGEYIKAAELMSTLYGTGIVLNAYGNSLEDMIMEVSFSDSIKKFGVMPVITGNVLMAKFADISEIGDAWDEAYNLHVDLTKKYRDCKHQAEQLQKAAERKAEADKKAAQKRLTQKEKSLKDYPDFSHKVSYII